MTQEKFTDVVGSQIEFCKSMLIKKGTEYAPENHAPGEMDRLAHFKKAAVMMNCTPKVALVGMLSKHLVSVVDMCLSDRVYSKKTVGREAYGQYQLSDDSQGNRRGGIG